MTSSSSFPKLANFMALQIEIDFCNRSSFFSSKPKSARLRLSNFCHRYFSDRMKRNPARCAECSGQMRIFNKQNGVLMSNAAIDHACVHLRKQMYFCRHCDCRFSTTSSVFAHLNHIHHLGATPENYWDTTSDYEQEITDMIKRCFPLHQEQSANGTCATAHPTKL